MDFLKDILGTELFEQVANAVNAYNGNEANKDKQIKIANLASGKYVDKNKYTDLEKLLNPIQKLIFVSLEHHILFLAYQVIFSFWLFKCEEIIGSQKCLKMIVAP